MWRWLGVLALVACGDRFEAAPDADVTTAEDGRGLVRVRYLGDGGRLDGLTVFFQDADSSLALGAKTDAAGRANAWMRPGGWVTVVLPNGAMWTYAGVRSGDDLVIDERTPETSEQRTVFNLQVADANADVYTLTSSCGTADITGAAEQPMPTVLADCGDTADLLITARSLEAGPFGGSVRYLYRRDVPVGAASTVVVDGDYVPAVSATVDALAIPPEVDRYVVTQALMREGREVSPRRAAWLDVEQGATSAVLAKQYVPPDGTTQTRVEASTYRGIAAQHMIAWAPSSATTTVDLGAVRLRAYLQKPRYVPTSRSLVWSELDEGTVADAVMATIVWPRLDGSGDHRWTILSARGDRAELALPLLPSPELVPPSNASVPTFVNLALDGGYERIRTNLLGRWRPGEPWPVDGATGRVDYVSYE